MKKGVMRSLWMVAVTICIATVIMLSPRQCKDVQAAIPSVTLTKITEPSEVETLSAAKDGVILEREGIVSFTVPEDGYVFLEKEYGDVEIYSDVAMTKCILDDYFDCYCKSKSVYVEKGTYYLRNEQFIEGCPEYDILCGYFMPKSVILKQCGATKINCGKYKIFGSYKVDGYSQLYAGKVNYTDIDASLWGDAKKSLTDTFYVTKNRTYTVKFIPDDEVYKGYPVMCKVSIKDIVDHAFKQKSVKKATKRKAGVIKYKCLHCSATQNKSIPAIKEVKVKSSVKYNRRAQKPTVRVYDKKGKKISSKYYTVKYYNNKKVGTAKVKVTFKNRYSGSITKKFKIVR